jgi:MFS family permease
MVRSDRALVSVQSMLSSLANVRTFLLAIFMIMAGSGFLSTLIAVRLETAGTSALTIGMVATAYFAGLAIGSLRATKIITSVGHIRAFAAFVSVLSASSLSYAIDSNVAFWLVLRFIDGLMISGIYICLESWLNERADGASRSSALAGYMVALYSGQAAGQFLLNAGKDTPALPFMFSAILLSLAVLPVVLTQVAQPVIDGQKPLSVRRLYEISPLGFVGVIATGMMLGAFYAMGPIFAQRLGMDLSAVALFTSCVITGGVVLQWPLGVLSDRFDRRRIIIAALLGTTVFASVIALFAFPGVHIFVLGAIFGGLTFALYPLCVAHSNDHIDGSERVSASGGLVLAYSIGAVAGPMLGSIGVAIGGPAGLFAAIGIVALLATLFGFWRMYASDAVPSEDQGVWQTLPRTTPMATSGADIVDE